MAEKNSSGDEIDDSPGIDVGRLEVSLYVCFLLVYKRDDREICATHVFQKNHV